MGRPARPNRPARAPGSPGSRRRSPRTRRRTAGAPATPGTPRCPSGGKPTAPRPAAPRVAQTVRRSRRRRRRWRRRGDRRDRRQLVLAERLLARAVDLDEDGPALARGHRADATSGHAHAVAHDGCRRRCGGRFGWRVCGGRRPHAEEAVLEVQGCPVLNLLGKPWSAVPASVGARSRAVIDSGDELLVEVRLRWSVPPLRLLLSSGDRARVALHC